MRKCGQTENLNKERVRKIVFVSLLNEIFRLIIYYLLLKLFKSVGYLLSISPQQYLRRHAYIFSQKHVDISRNNKKASHATHVHDDCKARDFDVKMVILGSAISLS